MLNSNLSKKIFLIIFLGLLTLSLMYISNGLYAKSDTLDIGGNNHVESFIDSNSMFNFAVADSYIILFADDLEDEDNETIGDNDFENETTESKNSPEAIISITSDKTEYKVGDTAIFEVRIQNIGDVDLTSLSVMFLLPKGLNFISSYTGTSNNNYNPNSGVWDVGNLRLTAEGAGLGPGVKRLRVTTIVTPEMAGKSFNLETYFLSLADDYGKPVLNKASSYSSFSVDSHYDEGNSNIKNNSTTNGANSTGNGEDVKQSKNNINNSSIGFGVFEISKKLADDDIALSDIKNNLTGLTDINSIDSSNPSSEDSMFEVKNLSNRDSSSEPPQDPFFIIAILSLIGIIVIGYFYGIRK